MTRNDLSSGICKPVTVIYARGTSELGNVGLIAGPPFFNALADQIGSQNIAVQGVDYAASIVGYLAGGDKSGASTMAGLIKTALSKCPETQIVLSGYRYVLALMLLVGSFQAQERFTGALVKDGF